MDVRCADECGSGRHTDLVPFGQQELDHRNSTVSCGACDEHLHDASLGLSRAAMLTSRSPEMKDQRIKRGQCACVAGA